MAKDSTDGQTKAHSSVTVDMTTKSDGAPRSAVSSQAENVNQSPPSRASMMQTPKPVLDDEQRQGLISSVSGRAIRAPDRLGGSPTGRGRGGAESLDSEDDGPRRNLSNRKGRRGSGKKEEPGKALEEAKIDRDRFANAYFEMKNAKKAMHKDFTEFRKGRAELNAKFKAEMVNRIELQKKLKQRDAEIGTLHERLRDQKARHEENLTEERQKFFKAQEAVSELMKKGATDSMPDDVVRNELMRIKAMWRPWAKDWAASSLGGLDPATLRMYVNFGSADKTSAEVEELYQTLLNVASAPSMLLNTILAQCICKRLFCKPFFFFTQKTSDGSSIRAAFDAVLQQAEHTQMAKACAWRAQTLQMLSPFVHVDSTTDEVDMQQSLVKALNREYARLATSFENLYAPLLKNVTDDEALKRYDELIGIWKEAGNLAYKLWSQKTQMECIFSFGSNKTFHIRSPLMKPHASMLCDHDSHEYNGRLAQLCVEPAILAFNYEQGLGHDGIKIWMPATVWMAEDISTRPSGPTSTAGKSTETTDVPIKKERDGEEGALDARPMKRVRLSPVVTRAETPKASASTTVKQEVHGQRSADSKKNSSFTPPSSKRNSEGKKGSAVKASARDPPSSINAYKKMAEGAKNNQGSAGSHQKNNLKKNKPSTPATSSIPRASQKNQPGMRSQMADQANIREMGEFVKVLAEAGRNENTYDQKLMTSGPNPGQPRPKNKPASIGEGQQEKEQAKGINEA